MKVTNRRGLPEAIVQAVSNSSYDPGEKVFLTASQFSTPPRQRVLTRLHWDELEEDAEDRIWSLLGQAVHAILERAEPSAITEERLYGEIGGQPVSGQFDRLTLTPDWILQDYKVTSVWAAIMGTKTEWETQLNVLRLLAIQNGYRIDKLEVVGIFRDWQVSKSREEDYPSSAVLRMPIPIWHDAEERLAEIVQRHLDAENDLPLCTQEERWSRGDRWAVIKKGQKRAQRVFDTEHEAKSMVFNNPGAPLVIEPRPGANRRCEDYCAVAKFCTQWAQLRGDQ